MKRSLILLVDPCPLIHAGFERLTEPFLEEMAMLPFRPFAEKTDLAVQLSPVPDLLIFDAAHPSADHWATLSSVPKRIAFSYRPECPSVKRWFRQGVTGVLCKSATCAEILSAIRAVRDGQVWLQPQLQQLFAEQALGLRRRAEPPNHLTPREKEVLSLIADECTTGEISKRLFISQCTVETHRLHLIQKLGVKNTAGLVRVAITNGLV